MIANTAELTSLAEVSEIAVKEHLGHIIISSPDLMAWHCENMPYTLQMRLPTL